MPEITDIDPMLHAPEDAEPQASSRPLAKRRWRLIAAILDSLLSAVLAVPFLWYSGVWKAIQAGEILGWQFVAGAMVWNILTFVGVNFWLLKHRGQTVGKWCVDVAIVGMDDQLQSVARVIGVRYLPVWVVAQIPFVGGLLVMVDSLFIFGSERRCLHDRIAGTKVVNVEG